MSCSNLILGSHRNAAKPLLLERARMKRAADGLKQALMGYLTEGCLEWAAEYRPDAARLFANSFDELDAIVSVGEGAAFVDAVQHCTQMYQRIEAIYAKEKAAAHRLTASMPPFRPWSGLAAPHRRGTRNPRGRDDRAALIVSGPAASRAPAPPQGREPSNGPDGAAA